jgi:hypothetical protein
MEPAPKIHTDSQPLPMEHHRRTDNLQTLLPLKILTDRKIPMATVGIKLSRANRIPMVRPINRTERRIPMAHKIRMETLECLLSQVRPIRMEERRLCHRLVTIRTIPMGLAQQRNQATVKRSLDMARHSQDTARHNLGTDKRSLDMALHRRTELHHNNSSSSSSSRDMGQLGNLSRTGDNPTEGLESILVECLLNQWPSMWR